MLLRKKHTTFFAIHTFIIIVCLLTQVNGKCFIFCYRFLMQIYCLISAQSFRNRWHEYQMENTFDWHWNVWKDVVYTEESIFSNVTRYSVAFFPIITHDDDETETRWFVNICFVYVYYKSISRSNTHFFLWVYFNVSMQISGHQTFFCKYFLFSRKRSTNFYYFIDKISFGMTTKKKIFSDFI